MRNEDHDMSTTTEPATGQTVAKLQADAAALADQLASARRDHEQAVADRAVRNRVRRQEFWGDGARAAAEHRRLAAALAQVQAAVQDCDGAATVGAYLTYARIFAEVRSFSNVAYAAMATLDADGRTHSPVRRLGPGPETLDTLLARFIDAAAAGRGDAYFRAQLAPLTDELEPEDG